MPVSDPFGPSVYVPDLNTGAGAASQGWAAGISNLGKALFPDPAAVAEARLKGAQTQQLQNATQAQSQLQTILGGDPNQAADPATRGKIIGLWSQLPADQQNSQRANLGAWISNAQNMSQQDKIQFLTDAGIVDYRQTIPGVNAQLNTQIQTAQIGAGATVRSAEIGAGATIGAAQIGAGEKKYEHDQTPVPVTTPSGTVYTPRVEVNRGGYTPAQPDLPSTAAVVTAGEQPGQVPLKTPPGSHGVPPPPQATQPQTGADSGQPATPTPGQALTSSITKTQTPPVPKENPAVTLQRIANGDLPRSTWAADPKTNPLGTYTVGPVMSAAVIGRAQQLAADRSSPYYLNQEGAMAQAYNEIVGPAKAANMLDFKTGYSPFPFTKNDPATVDFKPGYTPTPATPLAPNPQPAAVPAPVVPPPPAPLPPSNRAAIPAPAVPKPPAPKPPVPAPAAAKPPAGPTPAPAQGAARPALDAIPPEMRKPGVVYHGNIFVGGDPKVPTNWQVASPQQIENAKQNGLFAQ